MQLNLDSGLLNWAIDYGDRNLFSRAHGPDDLPPGVDRPLYPKEN